MLKVNEKAYNDPMRSLGIRSPGWKVNVPPREGSANWEEALQLSCTPKYLC